jgi:hypothetical protein
LVEVTHVPKTESDIQQWRLEAPERLLAAVEYTLKDEQDHTFSRRRSDVAAGDAFKFAISQIQQGALQVRLDFGIVGSIRLSIEPQPLSISPEELRERILDIGVPNNCGSWSYVRQIGRVPPTTNHKGLLGLKKRIRKVVLELRKERHA